MDNPSTYIRRSPGHKCEKCGADISFRNPNTKYCTDCKKHMFNEKQRHEREHYKILAARDTAMEPVASLWNEKTLTCPRCRDVVIASENFCSNCGQRLKEDNHE